jgi:hypothetical protein
LDSTKEQSGNRRHLWSGTPDCPVRHRTVSGEPPVMSGAPEDSNSKLATFGNFQRRLRYNSPDCPVYTGQCPVRQGGATSGTRQLRETPTTSPLKFTGLSGVHRTVRCDSGSNGYLRANGYLQRNKCARSARRSQARPYWHTGQQTVPVRCAPDTQAGPQVRSSNGQNPTAVMTWQEAPDCPVCTGLSGVPSSRQPPNGHFWWLGL